ncbi:hypothetical protein QTO34_008067 [Cnephaeus nilssonii]|uniref:General transcription factor II-I repeat domain-containing protein 2A n=1 Tax=Cnephaeus nilssonii TaxID=3371016 RepID=A0AA40IAV7_CNENI|nr:hypothetical protein QTO34_008067 [Eptesicus nilssonii]
MAITRWLPQDGHPHIITIWLPQDGQQGRAVGAIGPAGERRVALQGSQCHLFIHSFIHLVMPSEAGCALTLDPGTPRIVSDIQEHLSIFVNMRTCDSGEGWWRPQPQDGSAQSPQPRRGSRHMARQGPPPALPGLAARLPLESRSPLSPQPPGMARGASKSQMSAAQLLRASPRHRKALDGSCPAPRAARGSGALFDMATKKKKRKTEDENREFKVEWTETFTFIQNLNGLLTCLICQEKLVHNKKSNLERHFTTKHVLFSTKYPVGDSRKKAVEELQKSQEKSSSVFNYWMQSSNNVNIASFVVSQEIAKRGKPYTDGKYIKSCFINASEELFRDFKNKADILKKFKELPLSAKTVKDKTVKMSLNITDQQVEDLKLVSALSIAVDESCPKEELLGLLPLKGQTRREDIANAVIECIEKHHIPLDKMVSISTDGAKSMTSVKTGALCAQTFPEEICKVMELVINIINSIIAKALNHHQFKEFLVEMESEYADLLLHNKVRWLSRGNVLKRFAFSLTEIKAFLLEKGVHYPDLTNDQWIQKFDFMVDVTSHLNQLNRKLQGKENTISSMLEEVISFENKLSLFAQDFERETLIHFPSLWKHRQENNSDIDICYFKTTLLNMREAFLHRFQEFRNSKATLAFVKKPLNATETELNFSPFNIEIGNFEMQLLDLKNK